MPDRGLSSKIWVILQTQLITTAICFHCQPNQRVYNSSAGSCVDEKERTSPPSITKPASIRLSRTACEEVGRVQMGWVGEKWGQESCWRGGSGADGVCQILAPWYSTQFPSFVYLDFCQLKSLPGSEDIHFRAEGLQKGQETGSPTLCDPSSVHSSGAQMFDAAGPEEQLEAPWGKGTFFLPCCSLLTPVGLLGSTQGVFSSSGNLCYHLPSWVGSSP